MYLQSTFYYIYYLKMYAMTTQYTRSSRNYVGTQPKQIKFCSLKVLDKSRCIISIKMIMKV